METPDHGLKKDPSLLSLRAIESALKLVESKKQALKVAFFQLESHPSLNLLTFSWPDLNSHFSSIHDSLSLRFYNLLQSYDSTPESRSLNKPPHFSELEAACHKMNGHALRDYIIECLKDPTALKLELAKSLRSVPDPAVVVLNAVESFVTLNNKEKLACVLILEAFVRSKPEGVKEEIKQRAKNLGEEWLKSVNTDRGPTISVRVLLNLVAGFLLAKEMDVDKLVSCFSAASCSSSSPLLLKMAGMDSAAIGNLSETHPQSFIHLDNSVLVSPSASLVNKLIKEGKHIYAVRFVCELKLGKTYHPEKILKSYFYEKSCSSISARSKEIIELELAANLIKKYRISYPIAKVEQRIVMLKRKQGSEKRRSPEWNLGTGKIIRGERSQGSASGPRSYSKIMPFQCGEEDE